MATTKTTTPADKTVAKDNAVKAEIKPVETNTAAKKPETKTSTKKTETKAVSKKTETKAAEKKAVAKTETKKPAKTTVKKVSAKKTKAKKERNIFVQYSGMEFDTAAIEEAVKADYITKNKKKTFSSVNIYIKPEDMKVYYVIDGIIGDIAL